jgi:uncharacterized protein YeaO (DUF488 family)
MSINIEVKCAYELRDPSDGRRILVDRTWPRGLTKADADLDEWRKHVAPSTALRQWYSHCTQRFGVFRDRYLIELDGPAHAAALAHLRALTQNPLTLLTATKNLTTSRARMLAERLAWGHPVDRPTMFRVHISHQGDGRTIP